MQGVRFEERKFCAKSSEEELPVLDEKGGTTIARPGVGWKSHAAARVAETIRATTLGSGGTEDAGSEIEHAGQKPDGFALLDFRGGTEKSVRRPYASQDVSGQAIVIERVGVAAGQNSECALWRV